MNLKIKHKLFSAIILANLLVVLGVYALTNWSFSRSFRDYLDASQVAKLAPLNQALSELYASNNGWDWAKDRQDPTWMDLIEQYTPQEDALAGGFEPGRRRPAEFDRNRRPKLDRQVENINISREKPPRERPPREKPPLDPPTPRPQIFLADENHQVIIGRRNIKNEIYWIKINHNENTVGYLGFLKNSEITDELDQLLLEKLKSNLSWSLIFVILVSAIIAMFVARLMVKPLLKLRAATKDISAGDFDKKIEVNSADEVGELCNDFNRLALTLKNNLKARQQWITDISHELRTPVAILQGELEAIQDGVRPVSGGSINSLHQEVTRLGLLINDLHELSLSDNGALSYSFEQLFLVDLIDNVFELKRESINKKQFKINHQKSEIPVSINADPHRLTQLFLNLLNNSLAYTHNGGLIEVSYLVVANTVSISWADSSPGVSDEQLAKLFDRLYRVESSRNRDLGGSGLGLSIVQNIVVAHDGTIKAFHAEHGGVEFKIILPLEKN